MTLGFACAWDEDPTTTWSGTSWQLLTALRSLTSVADLGPHLPGPARSALRLAHVRRTPQGWKSKWQHGAVTARLVEEMARRAARHHGVDAVVEIQDLAAFDVPFHVVQDLSYDALVDLAGSGLTQLQFAGMSPSWIAARRERQLALYERAAGLLPMSAWLGRQLVERSGVPAAKVTVVPAGASVAPRPDEPEHALGDGPPRLLFVGRDFHRKGGDIAVRAAERLARDHAEGLRLTVCGPTDWPLPGSPPACVDFVGPRPLAGVADLFRSHDLFVLPSRFEAFGIVFVEALSFGVPAVGRDAFAMPEVVRPGDNGALVRSDDPDELAAAVVAALDDTTMRERVAKQAPEVAAASSWVAAARRVLAAVEPGGPVPGSRIARRRTGPVGSRTSMSDNGTHRSWAGGDERREEA